MATDDAHSSRPRRLAGALILLAAVAAVMVVLVHRYPGPLPRPEAAVEPVSPAPPPSASRAETEPGPAGESVAQPAVETADAPGDRVMDHDELTVAELRARARELGITGYSRLRKTELIRVIRDAAG